MEALVSRPKSIKVSGQRYRISYDLVATGEDDDTLGLCDQASSTIRIQSHLQEDKQASVLAHELTHACIDESAMSGRKRFNVEEVCDIVGYHVLTVLKDNPALLEWLVKDFDVDAAPLTLVKTVVES